MKTKIYLSESIVEVDNNGPNTGLTYEDMIKELLKCPDYYSAYRPGMRGIIKIDQRDGELLSFFDIEMGKWKAIDKLTLADVTAHDWKISVYAD